MKKETGTGSFKFLEELAERTNQVVFAFDMDSRQFIYLNPSFEQVWNKTRESTYASPASLLENIHPKDMEYVHELYQKLSEKPEEVENKEVAFRIIHPDKSVRWLSLVPVLIDQETDKRTDKRIVTGFLNDITYARENEVNVQKFASKKNSLLEILSHDLSGPLVNIQGLSSLISKEFKEYKNPKLDRLIQMIEQTSERSISMIREFVKQEFIESASVELVRKRVNLVEVISMALDQYKVSEKDLSKKFCFEASEDEIFSRIDEYKFNQVLNNLISNSIKFTHDGGEISIRIEVKGKMALLTLSDDGIGIPERFHENLFEKFTKARRPGLKGEPSVGLGMSLIRKIVEWHDGKIWFESEKDKGTTFFIELPKE